MSLTKQAKDHLVRLLLGSAVVPSGLVELQRYFRLYGPIRFHSETQEDGSIMLVSDGFRHGTIITRVVNTQELDARVKDAILTAFEVPSSYAKEAALHRVGESEYAIA